MTKGIDVILHEESFHIPTIGLIRAVVGKTSGKGLFGCMEIPKCTSAPDGHFYSVYSDKHCTKEVMFDMCDFTSSLCAGKTARSATTKDMIGMLLNMLKEIDEQKKGGL